ncbi:MAG TPA: FAD-binding oxidoreductase [Candidatus Limnocylindria bacterium]|nr:FAD-binding oxidoreductase [Candidatus Limnocylindria bacterium]
MEDAGPTQPALPAGATADVCVIGGGLTGLSVARALRELGLSVVVLEARHAGFGASGRNAGHLTPVIGKDLPTLTTLFGRERARRLIALVQTAIEHVEHTIRDCAIDCAYEPVGNVLAAVHPRQHKTVDATAAAGEALGLDGELLDAAAMRRRGLPEAFTRGYFMRRGGILDPGRYVVGLLGAARAAGVEIYEQTPVLRIEDGDPVLVHTRHGRVRASAAVIATNAYTPELGRLRSTALRVQVSLFRTAPLPAAERQAIGWPGREGIYTAHEVLESYRLTADDRIVGGAKRVRYAYGGRPLGDDPATHAFIEGAFRARFPPLGGVDVTERWSGPIAFALDFLPAVGCLGRHRNVYYSIGYAGHGLALASYAGPMIADLMQGRDGPGSALWAHWKVPLPPEPLRWLTVRAINGLLERKDHRIDRQLAGS